MSRNVIVILGPTACGKTAFAVALARRLGGAVISADSRQVYRGLDIGSGKDLDEYTAGGEPVMTRLLDIADPSEPEPYTLADFMRDAKAAILELESLGRIPILCGGTGLYIHALIKGYELPGGPADREFRRSVKNADTEALTAHLSATHTLENGEADNPYRLSRRLEIERAPALRSIHGGPLPDTDFLVLGARRPRPEIHQRIEKRLDERLHNGMLDEIRNLHEQGVSWEKLESFGLEYREVSRFLQGKMLYPDMRDRLLVRIRQFAKRQDTWFRKMEREGVTIHWLPPENLDEAERLCREFLDRNQN